MTINTAIVGAGQLGSRHLQALKRVKHPLQITVIDPNGESLTVAKERYDSFPAEDKNSVLYKESFNGLDKNINLAIIPTSSAVRKEALFDLLERTDIKYLILEKLLFQKEDDLFEVQHVIDSKNIKAWVNCPMRMMPFYRELKKEFNGPLKYQLSGSGYGLVTNAIHYLDYMVYLTGCDDFELNCERLEPKLVSSKRQGYKELNGTIQASFKDGSMAEITSYENKKLPLFAQIFDQEKRILINEPVQKAYWINADTGGELKEVSAGIPYQSELTTILVDQLLDTGDCYLPTYHSSVKTHQLLMRGLMQFINKYTNYKDKLFPFT